MNYLLNEYILRDMQKNEIKFVAEMLANIFIDNQVYASMFPDVNTGINGLKCLFNSNLKLHYKKKCTKVVVAKCIHEIKNVNDVVGTLTWVPPTGLATNPFDYLKSGVLLMPFTIGVDSIKRIFYLKDANDMEVDAAMAGKPHWYLGMVAVQGSYRGKGIGTAMIKHHLENVIDSDSINNQNVPTALTTQLASNVSLYRKLGFAIAKENEIGYGDDKIHTWCMVRHSNAQKV